MYIVDRDLTVGSSIIFTGDTELILCDGVTLTVDGYFDVYGKISIYGQTKGTGTLKTTKSVTVKELIAHGVTLAINGDG